MDINMPLMDGKQALAVIKKDEILHDIPLVLFTTSSSPLDKSFAMKYEVDFITKPVKESELHCTVKQLLSYCKEQN